MIQNNSTAFVNNSKNNINVNDKNSCIDKSENSKDDTRTHTLTMNNPSNQTSTATATCIKSNTTAINTKVNLSLLKAKKKRKVKTKNVEKFESHDDTNNENLYSTIAEAASVETKKREEQGIQLVIPLNEERNKNEPLLQGLKRIVEKDDDENKNEKDQNDDTTVEDKNNDQIDTTYKENDARFLSDERINNDKLHKVTDEDAEKELIAQSLQENKEGSTNNNATNFSSKGSLIISQSNNNKNQQQKSSLQNKREIDDDTIKYQRDLKHRAKDVSVHSESYVFVPISEFGAAMLRGMGWKGGGGGGADQNTKSKNGDKNVMNAPRPHRLGLGATSLPPSMKNNNNKINSNQTSSRRHYARKGGKMNDRAMIEKEEEEERMYKAKLEELKRQDVQKSLQIGSIVRVRDEINKRAKMVKISGVPGLNRVLIRYEGGHIDVSVRRSSVVLIERKELEDDPFLDQVTSTTNGKKENKAISTDSMGMNVVDEEKKREQKKQRSRNETRSKSRSRSRERKNKRKKDRRNRRSRSHSREYDGNSKGKSKRRRPHEYSHDSADDDDSYIKSRKDRIKDDDIRKKSRDSRCRSDEKRRKEKRSRRHIYSDDESFDSCKKDRKRSKKSRHKDEKMSRETHSDHQDWLTPNIRVRVVKKGRQFKQKGVVMDVFKQGTDAILHMADGEVLEHISEKYLETALPKVGGNVMILTGPNQYAKGKLLERNSEKCQGVVQLSEDMNVVTIPLDDMAEWCGSLDEEY